MISLPQDGLQLRQEFELLDARGGWTAPGLRWRAGGGSQRREKRGRGGAKCAPPLGAPLRPPPAAAPPKSLLPPREPQPPAPCAGDVAPEHRRQQGLSEPGIRSARLQLG